MIDAMHKLPIVRQAQLLDLARSSVNYQPQPTSHVASGPHGEHAVFPYLLRGVTIAAWPRVLTVMLDWASRRVLAWRLSISLAADGAVEASEEAIANHGTPEIMNPDQGSQFTAAAFIDVLRHHEIRISMDGKGCWRDNVFVSGRGSRLSTSMCTSTPTSRREAQRN